MAKINQGRLDGVNGMEQFTALELFALAEEIEGMIVDSENTDDPKWLQRRVDRIKLLAEQKEKSLEHKQNN